MHNPRDFLTARRVRYALPQQVRVPGAQLRWWQPEHRGQGYDQWALDHVETTVYGFVVFRRFLFTLFLTSHTRHQNYTTAQQLAHCFNVQYSIIPVYCRSGVAPRADQIRARNIGVQ